MTQKTKTNVPSTTDIPIGFDALPDSAFVREAELVRSGVNPAGVLPFSKPTLWRKVKDGSFPRPHKLAARVTAWRVKEVRDWINACACTAITGGVERLAV